MWLTASQRRRWSLLGVVPRDVLNEVEGSFGLQNTEGRGLHGKEAGLKTSTYVFASRGIYLLHPPPSPTSDPSLPPAQ